MARSGCGARDRSWGALRIGACARRDLIDLGRYSLCPMSTGSMIRDARLADGLTQAQLARRLGITQPSVARLEAAGDEVAVATLQRALDAMGRALVLPGQGGAAGGDGRPAPEAAAAAAGG